MGAQFVSDTPLFVWNILLILKLLLNMSYLTSLNKVSPDRKNFCKRIKCVLY